MRGESICGRVSQAQDEWLPRRGLCFGCMRKTNDVPPIDENGNQKKDKSSVILTENMAGWFRLWLENRVDVLFLFPSVLLMRLQLQLSFETPHHQCISQRPTNHKNVNKVTTKHISPRLYQCFCECARVSTPRKKQAATKRNTRVTEMQTHRVGISQETAKYFSLQCATLDAII